MSRGPIVVTGGTGFVGSSLVRRLVDGGERVIALLRSPEEAPEGVHAAFPWDMGEGAPPPEAFRDARALVHCAAFLPPNFGDPAFARECLELNALGSLALFRAAAESAVPTVVSFSSGNVYRDRERPASEDDPVFPSAHAPFYLASKLVQEIYAEHVAVAHDQRLVTLRPSAVYGPGMAARGVLPTFAARLLAGETIRVEDGGRYGVDMVFVEDVARAATVALERPVRGTFNIGSGRRTTVLELASVLTALTGAPDDRVVVLPAEEGPPGGFAPLDISRAQAQLDHRPIALSEGLRSYIDWLAEGSS